MSGIFSFRNLLKSSVQKYLKFTYKNASTLTAANLSSDHRHIILNINESNKVSNSEQLKYPLVWLRDNCQCSNCFHSQTKSRSIDWTKFDFNHAQPKSINVSASYSIRSINDNSLKFKKKCKLLS